jgi:DNA-binding NtrC family response regulator
MERCCGFASAGDGPDETPGQAATEPGHNEPVTGSRGAMVVHDPAMLALLRRVEDVAASNATVLVSGESGTGKELIAAHLHRHSGRRGAFVAVNCAGIPDALLESELFGHEEGAFCGATTRRIGKFEAADGGTLLLDEIGEMDLRMQAKVLRAVQQREIDRVGGNGPVKVDVRIVATTNRNLQQDVRCGRFRAELLFRLNVITLKVKPLRERPGDIAPLAEFFAQHFARQNGRPADTITPHAMTVLRQHSWPGNVRELENVMHRAVLTEAGPAITPAAIDIDTVGMVVADVPELVVEAAARPALTGRTIEAVEKDLILDTLWQSKGNRSQAAATLGISIRTLRNKLHEYERSGTPIPRQVVIAVR